MSYNNKVMQAFLDFFLLMLHHLSSKRVSTELQREKIRLSTVNESAMDDFKHNRADTDLVCQQFGHEHVMCNAVLTKTSQLISIHSVRQTLCRMFKSGCLFFSVLGLK